MDLKFHGMYRFIEMGKFYLPQDHQNFDVLIGVFQVLNMVQVSYLRTSHAHTNKSFVINLFFRILCLRMLGYTNGLLDANLVLLVLLLIFVCPLMNHRSD